MYALEPIEDEYELEPAYELEPIEDERFDWTPYKKMAAQDAEDVREGLKAVGSGLVSWIPAGLSMFSFDKRGLEERAKTAKDIQETLTYEPKTEGGRKMAEYAAKPFEWMAEAGVAGGEFLEEQGYKRLGAVSRFTGEALPFLLPAALKAGKMGLRGAKAKVKAVEMPERPAPKETMYQVEIPPVETRGVPVGEPYGPEPLARPERVRPVEEQKLLPERIETKDYVLEEVAEKPVAETLPEAKVGPAPKEIVQPGQKIKVYRGEGAVKFGDSFASDPGDLGRGIYHTTSISEAKAYGAGGKVTESTIKFDNPLVLSEKDAYALADKYGTLRGTTEQRLAGSQKMTTDLVKQGYDGLISIGKDSVGTGQRMEVVDYRSVQKIVQPGATSGGKQPWEMTRAEFLEAHKESRSPVFRDPDSHEALVKEAISRGRPIPPEVLKDYPELGAKPVAKGRAKGAENAVTYLERQGGVNWGPSYNYREMRQDVDAARISRKAGMAPDEAADILNGEGFKHPDGGIWDADRLAEIAKTGQLRKVFTPEKQDVIIERENRRQTNEWAEEQARFAAEQNLDPAAVRDAQGTHKSSLLEEIRSERDIPADKEAAIVAELDGFFDSKRIEKFKGEAETAEIPGASARETFDLVNPETEMGVLKPKDRGPQSTTLFGGIPDPTQIPGVMRELGKSIKAEWENIESTSPLAKTAGEKIGKTIQGVKEGFLDPERILKADPTGQGREIFKTLATAEESKNAFLEPRLNEFVKRTRGIESGSVASERIGKALDGKIDPATLKPSERQAFDHLKNEYDFLIKEYARRAAGSEEAYNKALQKAANKHEAKVRVEDLDDINKSQYKSLSNDANQIRGNKKLEELSPEAKNQYWEKRREMSDLLHNEWLKTLTEGEAEAYNILSRKIKDYLPHLFDRAELVDMFQREIGEINNKLRTATSQTAINGFKTRLKELETAVVKMNGGYMVTYSELPRNIRFRFFETRKGKAGYSYDAVKAYQSYLYGISKKMFDEQAIRTVRDLYKDMDPSLKPYTKELVKNYMGWNRNPLDWLAGSIASLEWMRTLGLNPRSAIVNLTQRINTAVYVGEKYAFQAEKMMLLEREKANAIFEKSGIAREVPQVLTEGPMPQGMERIRSIVGFMFNKVELGNRKHAFLSGYLKALEKGLPEEQAMGSGIKTVHKTQFRYGKLGMPTALRHPVGRVALQFTSYPLKQAQFLWDLTKKDPVALMKYIAYAEGINYGVREFFDTDLSNALGFGITWGEVWDSVRDLAGGDMRGAYRHAKQAVQRGGGLLPSGFGPAVSGAMSVAEKAKEGRGFKQFLREVKPVMMNRIEQAYEAVQGEADDLYPVKDSSGHVMYKLTGRQLLQRTIGPKTAKETESARDYEARKNLELERKEVLQDITAAIIDGDKERVKALFEKYQVFPTNEMLEREILNRKYTREERRKFGVREQYQVMREGRTY